MPTKTRIIIVSILILLGGVLFCYCTFFYPIEMTAQAKGDPTTAIVAKPAPVKKTATESVEQDKSCQTKPTRSESKSRPRSGAT
jgi:hypothetical protein